MPPFQFAAQSYQARSLPLDAQRAVNMFVERSPKDAKDVVPIFMAPGLDIFSSLGTGPINGLHVMSNVLYAVSGSQLFSINLDGLATLIGTTNLGSICSMDDNGTQLVMVDGNVGWIYQVGGLNQVLTAIALAGATSIVVAQTGFPASGDTIKITLDSGAIFTTTISGTPTGTPGNLTITLAAPLPSQATTGAIAIDPAVTLGQITAPAFFPSNTVVYFDDYFAFDRVGTNEWFISALGDGTQYNGLDFASAQAGPDLVLAICNYHEQLLIFSEKHTEVWYDAGAANFPFQRYDGAFIQRGIAAPLAIVKEDNTVFWLGEDGIFYRLNYYTPQRISTFATEHAWAQYPTIADATAFVVTIEGHKFIFLTFPSGPATWCYDISSGIEEPLWHERISWGNPWVAGGAPPGPTPPPPPTPAPPPVEIAAGEATGSFGSSLDIGNGVAVEAGDVLYIGVATDDTVAVTGISGSGLTFTKRWSGQILTPGEPVTMSTWVAIAGAPMSGFSVTATTGSEFDDIVANWILVRGAATSPFDPNVALPKVTMGAPPADVVFSTSNPDDLLLFFFSGDNGMWISPPPSKVTPAAWNYVTSAGNSGGFGFASMGIYSQTVSVAQAGALAGSAISIGSGTIFYVDALTANS